MVSHASSALIVNWIAVTFLDPAGSFWLAIPSFLVNVTLLLLVASTGGFVIFQELD